MSIQNEIRRLTAPDIRSRKGGDPIVSLTSYHAHTARLLDAHCDLILVGDSLGMVMHGLETTVPVTLDMMIAHGAAVVRGSAHACVMVDLPFGSYQESPQQAFRSAARVLADEVSARRLVEKLAMTLQASLLVRHAPDFVADAYLASRIEGDWGSAFGTLPRTTAFADIIERAAPR